MLALFSVVIYIVDKERSNFSIGIIMSDILIGVENGIKRLASIKKDMDELQLKEIILEQKSLLLDAKEEILNLRESNSKQAQTLKEMTDASKRSKSLVEIEGFKYDAVDGNSSGLPYCPTCEVKEDGKLYRLNRANDHHSVCPNCKTGYQVGKNGSVHRHPTSGRTSTRAVY